MSYEITKQEIKMAKKLYEISDGQRIEPEIVLPDYCKEIKKLLKCTFTPGIHSVYLSGERATAKGTGVIRVLYLGEGDVIDVFEKSCDLTSSVQMKDVPDDAVITAKQTVDFLNCRVTGQRKLSVSIGLSTVFTCLCTKKELLIDRPTQCNLQTKPETAVCEVCNGFFEKTFDLSETVVLNSEHPAVGKTVSADAFCKTESCKISSGKLLIKGEACIDICCLEEEAENRFHRINHTMPISQIVDIGQSNTEANADVTLRVTQLSCNLKVDSSGKNRLIELSLRVSALVCLFEKKKLEIITDCYCTEYETEAVYEKSGQLCPVREINETPNCKGEIEFSDKVKEILSIKCLDITEKISYAENSADFLCTATFGIIYTDEKNIPSYCEKNTDFTFRYSFVKKSDNPLVFFEIEPLSVTASVSGEKAEISMDYRVRGRIYCKLEKEILKELKILEDKPKTDSSAALTLYFSNKDESLWDIAKSHNTTVELIQAENSISTDKTLQAGMLLIPCI